jgi:hypothetical protein
MRNCKNNCYEELWELLYYVFKIGKRGDVIVSDLREFKQVLTFWRIK